MFEIALMQWLVDFGGLVEGAILGTDGQLCREEWVA
jgi:hypothetical protein